MGAIEEYIAKMQGRDYYDNRLGAVTRAAQMRAADLQAQYSTGKQHLQGQYDYDSSTINQALEQALVGLGGTFADRGTLRSSMYVNEQGNTSNRAQQQLQAAAMRRTQGLAELEQGLRTGNTDILSTLNLEESDATGRRAAAQHQAELERQQQEYNQQMLEYQRQQQAQQQDYYAQQAQLQEQAQQQQQQYYQQMAAAMQPVATPTGQVGYNQTAIQQQAQQYQDKRWPTQVAPGRAVKVW